MGRMACKLYTFTGARYLVRAGNDIPKTLLYPRCLRTLSVTAATAGVLSFAGEAFYCKTWFPTVLRLASVDQSPLLARQQAVKSDLDHSTLYVMFMLDRCTIVRIRSVLGEASWACALLRCRQTFHGQSLLGWTRDEETCLQHPIQQSLALAVQSWSRS